MNGEESTLRISWPADLQANKELFAEVQRANKVLAEELGRAKGFVAADWRLVPDGQNGTHLELSLADLFTKSRVTETYTPDELRDEWHLGSRFHRMWGRLLRARTERQIRMLEELASQVEEV